MQSRILQIIVDLMTSKISFYVFYIITTTFINIIDINLTYISC